MSDEPAWSMTGYGQGQSALADGQVEVQIRTVNHRHADLRVKACAELLDHAPWLEDRLRGAVRRGRAEVTVRLQTAAEHAVRLDTERARAVYQQLLALRDALDPGQPVPLTLLAHVPGGIFSQAGNLPHAQVRTALAEAADQAVVSLDAMRRQEGVALVRDMLARLDVLEQLVDWVEQRRPQVVDAARDRMRTRLSKLLEGVSVNLDEGRVEHEIALFADRSDIAEEITRLRSHLAQFRKLAHSGGDPVGRKLDFLVQEMGREVNTMGSKAGDAPIAQRVVDLKAELERIREQVQNVL